MMDINGASLCLPTHIHGGARSVWGTGDPVFRPFQKHTGRPEVGDGVGAPPAAARSSCMGNMGAAHSDDVSYLCHPIPGHTPTAHDTRPSASDGGPVCRPPSLSHCQPSAASRWPMMHCKVLGARVQDAFMDGAFSILFVFTGQMTFPPSTRIELRRR